MIFWEGTVAEPNVKEFSRLINGQTILEIIRRGKFIVFTLDHFTLLVHLRMTGKFTLTHGQEEPLSSHERIRLYLHNGWILHYEDQRKFGKWSLLAHPEIKLDALGIEPLSPEFTLEAFKRVLKNSAQKIKPFLLNQSKVVGLGNIYVDEALWLAKIHPEQSVSAISEKKILSLHQAIISVLQQGIANKGTSLGTKQANYYTVSGKRGGNQTQLQVFRQEGCPCPRCKGIIVKIRVAQRGTHLCPNCQQK